MKNQKLAKLALASVLALGMIPAADAAETASQTLNAVLAAHINVTAYGGIVDAVIDPMTGALDQAFTPAFRIQNNVPATIYIQATTTTEAGSVTAFFTDGTTQYVALSNTTAGQIPTAAAYTSCTGATPDPTTNPNIIAYPIASIVLVRASSSTTPTYDATKSQYYADVKNGNTVATTTTGQAARLETYSFDDTPGTYQAVVTMTTTSL